MDKEILKIFEEAARGFLQQSLNSRYDICTCTRCKNEMLALAVEELSLLAVPEAVASAQGIRETYQKEIAHALLHAIEKICNNPGHPATDDKKKEFKRLLEKISAERGLDLRNYHTELLKRRVALRLQKNNISSYAEYISFLEKKPSEFDKLFETLCINVSEFLRDPPVWITAQYLFENLIRVKLQNHEPSLSIWSAGCACGEEAYSIAISLKEALRVTSVPIRTSIKATDIDKACLKAAAEARYSKDSLKNINHRFLARYFELSEGKFRVKNDIRAMVDFEYLDLTSQHYPKNLDVIFCRNVFIYFNRDLQKEILMKFYESLKPGGYVLMGKSESLFVDRKDVFETIDINARIFKKLTPSPSSSSPKQHKI